MGTCGCVEDCSRAQEMRRQDWRLVGLFLLTTGTWRAEVLWFVEHVVEFDELWYLLCVAPRWRSSPCAMVSAHRPLVREREVTDSYQERCSSTGPVETP
jgi:hypothetical protein